MFRIDYLTIGSVVSMVITRTQARRKRNFDSRLRKVRQNPVAGHNFLLRRDYATQQHGGTQKLGPLPDTPFCVFELRTTAANNARGCCY